MDDTRDLPALIERAFGRVCHGTVVYPLTSGERALEHLLLCGERFPMPDLVLLDRHMPGGMDGFETLTALRKVERLAGLAVLMISGSDDEEHVARARVVGADGYFRKPVTVDEMPVFVRQIIRWMEAREQESWRSSGGTVSGLSLATRPRDVESAAMSTAHPVIDHSHLQDEHGILGVVHFVRELIIKTLDPVDLAINEACRRHHIPVSDARGRAQDQVTVANRHAVIFDLMDTGWADRVVLDNFQLSQRAIERLRAEWRARKGGGSLADGRS